MFIYACKCFFYGYFCIPLDYSKSLILYYNENIVCNVSCEHETWQTEWKKEKCHLEFVGCCKTNLMRKITSTGFHRRKPLNSWPNMFLSQWLKMTFKKNTQFCHSEIHCTTIRREQQETKQNKKLSTIAAGVGAKENSYFFFSVCWDSFICP